MLARVSQRQLSRLTSTSMALPSPAPERQNRRRRLPSARTHCPGSSRSSRLTTAAPEGLARDGIDLHGAGRTAGGPRPVDDDREHGDGVPAGQLAHLDAGAEAADDNDVGR